MSPVGFCSNAFDHWVSARAAFVLLIFPFCVRSFYSTRFTFCSARKPSPFFLPPSCSFFTGCSIFLALDRIHLLAPYFLVFFVYLLSLYFALACALSLPCSSSCMPDLSLGRLSSLFCASAPCSVSRTSSPASVCFLPYFNKYCSHNPTFHAFPYHLR
jgi:hypothetical protein